MKKSGFVAICGRANVGKSTLLNALIGEKISIVSHKPQTTRNKILGILNTENAQIIFTDIPGIHKPKTKLGKLMTKSIADAVSDTDVVLFMTEAGCTRLNESEEELLKKIESMRLPAILVINKIDLASKEEILKTIDEISKLYDFASVIPVSSVNKDGLDIVINEIEKLLQAGPEYYPADMITDQTERQIAAEIIREKALFVLNEEVPHGIAVEITQFKKRADKEIIDISANIYCEKDSHKGIIIGKNGSVLKKIASGAREDLEGFFKTKVFLECWVKVKEDWRNNNFLLKDLGFDK